jgi:isoleucyl-tRNA synthetase
MNPYARTLSIIQAGATERSRVGSKKTLSNVVSSLSAWLTPLAPTICSSAYGGVNARTRGDGVACMVLRETQCQATSEYFMKTAAVKQTDRSWPDGRGSVTM